MISTKELVMVEQQTRFIIEVRKGYTLDEKGRFLGGEWEVVKDEFGSDLLFEFYCDARRELKGKCPEVEMFGNNAGRVKEVVMLPKRGDGK